MAAVLLVVVSQAHDPPPSVAEEGASAPPRAASAATPAARATEPRGVDLHRVLGVTRAGAPAPEWDPTWRDHLEAWQGECLDGGAAAKRAELERLDEAIALAAPTPPAEWALVYREDLIARVRHPREPDVACMLALEVGLLAPPVLTLVCPTGRIVALSHPPSLREARERCRDDGIRALILDVADGTLVVRAEAPDAP